MLYAIGSCTNSRCCSLASAGRALYVRQCDRFVCPQCGKALVARVASRRLGVRLPLVAGLAAIGFLAGSVAGSVGGSVLGRVFDPLFLGTGTARAAIAPRIQGVGIPVPGLSGAPAQPVRVLLRAPAADRV